MDDSALQALLVWLRPRSGWKWIVAGEIGVEGLQTLIGVANPSQITVVTDSERAADVLRGAVDARVTVLSDYSSLRSNSNLADVTLDYGTLEGATDPVRMIDSLARGTRLAGLVVGIENNSVSRRTLWDWWLDARLNDVSSRQAGGCSMVRGTR